MGSKLMIDGYGLNDFNFQAAKRPRGYFKTRAIVLLAKPHGEKDRKIEMITEDFGKISAIARGARKLESPFVGRLQPLNLCQLLLYRGKTGNWTVAECSMEKTFRISLKTYEKIQTIFKVIEMLKTIRESETSEEIFTLVYETMESLEKEKSIFILKIFQIKLLKFLGTLPEFAYCEKCSEKIHFRSSRMWIPTENVCIKCDEKKYPVMRAMRDQYSKKEGYKDRYRKLVQFIKNRSYAEIKKIKMDEDDQKTLSLITEKLWSSAVY